MTSSRKKHRRLHRQYRTNLIRDPLFIKFEVHPTFILKNTKLNKSAKKEQPIAAIDLAHDPDGAVKENCAQLRSWQALVSL
jgi:hypothetical protein